MLALISVQSPSSVPPPERVTCTLPSSVPTQITPSSTGDSETVFALLLSDVDEKTGKKRQPLLEEIPLDPWKNQYGYEPPESSGSSPRVYTLGADGSLSLHHVPVPKGELPQDSEEQKYVDRFGNMVRIREVVNRLGPGIKEQVQREGKLRGVSKAF